MEKEIIGLIITVIGGLIVLIVDKKYEAIEGRIKNIFRFQIKASKKIIIGVIIAVMVGLIILILKIPSNSKKGESGISSENNTKAKKPLVQPIFRPTPKVDCRGPRLFPT